MKVNKEEAVKQRIRKDLFDELYEDYITLEGDDDEWTRDLGMWALRGTMAVSWCLPQAPVVSAQGVFGVIQMKPMDEFDLADDKIEEMKMKKDEEENIQQN